MQAPPWRHSAGIFRGVNLVCHFRTLMRFQNIFCLYVQGSSKKKLENGDPRQLFQPRGSTKWPRKTKPKSEFPRIPTVVPYFGFFVAPQKSFFERQSTIWAQKNSMGRGTDTSVFTNYQVYRLYLIYKGHAEQNFGRKGLPGDIAVSRKNQYFRSDP